MVSWEIDDEEFIVADADDPDLLVSLWEPNFKVKKWDKLLHMEVKSADDTVFVEAGEHTFFAEADPFEQRIVGNRELPVIDSFE